MAPIHAPAVLEASAVAELLQCEVTTVEERARAGELPGLKFGRGWVFPAGALAQRLDELALEQAASRRSVSTPTSVQFAPKARRTPPVLA